MLRRLRAASLLEASRGHPPRDADALAGMIVGLSRLAVECGPWLEALDINPVIVQPEGEGACAVDALVILRQAAASRHLDTGNVI